MIELLAIFLMVYCGYHLIRHGVNALKRFFGFSVIDKNNPYYKKHKQKLSNDRQHREYLNWASRTNQDFVIDKVKPKEEIEQDRKIKGLIE